MFSSIVYEVRRGIAHIALNSPPSNIISEGMAQELREACFWAKEDGGVRAVVITGTGEAFCCGNELKRRIEGQKLTRGELDTVISIFGVCEAISGIDCPVVAAINGDALGAGLEVALCCDIRIASRGARFGFPDIGVGLLPLDGGTQRLPRIIGRGRGLEMILTGELIDTAQALEIGLVSKIVAPGELSSEMESWMERIASQAPIALRYGKEAINKGLDLSLEQGLRLEADLYLLLHTTSDRTEGITAFLQKRKAQFRGE